MAGFKKIGNGVSPNMGSTGFQQETIQELPPGTPTIGTATNVGTNRAYNNGAATVTFTPNTSLGVNSSFTVTSSPGSTELNVPKPSTPRLPRQNQ